MFLLKIYLQKNDRNNIKLLSFVMQSDVPPEYKVYYVPNVRIIDVRSDFLC